MTLPSVPSAPRGCPPGNVVSIVSWALATATRRDQLAVAQRPLDDRVHAQLHGADRRRDVLDRIADRRKIDDGRADASQLLNVPALMLSPTLPEQLEQRIREKRRR